MLAATYVQAKKPDQAVEVLLKKAAAESGESKLQVLALASAVSHVSAAVDTKVEAALTAARQQASESATLNLILADRLLKQGKFGEALPLYEALLAATSDDVVALNNYAMALANAPNSGSDNPRRAIAMAEKAIELAGPKLELLDTQALA